MKKTALIYGFALSTLVAAFLLVPRSSPQTPLPSPPVPAQTEKPVTEIRYANAQVHVRARLDRGYRQVTSSDPIYMDVEIRAAEAPHDMPLSVVLVIDRSGSMAGDKIEAARAAAARFVQKMRETDRLGIVTYGTDVDVIHPMGTLAAGRSAALAAVARIEESGGTNIDGGLRAALSLLGDGSANQGGRVVLITDGQPTEGDTTESGLLARTRDIRQAGFSVSTIGVGVDYNEDLMERMATQGGGRYHYLRNGEYLAKIFDDELQHATSVVARNVRLSFPSGTIHQSEAREMGYVVQDLVHDTEITIGDLAGGEVRHVVVKVANSQLEFPAPSLSFSPTSGERLTLGMTQQKFRVVLTDDTSLLATGTNRDVLERVTQVQASVALQESMRHYAAGDVAKATATLQQKKAEVRQMAAQSKNAELATQAANMERVFDQIEKMPTAAGEAAQDMIKEQKARAYQQRQ